MTASLILEGALLYFARELSGVLMALAVCFVISTIEGE